MGVRVIGQQSDLVQDARAARSRPFLQVELETVIGIGAGVPILVDHTKRLIRPPRLERCGSACRVHARIQIDILPQMGSARSHIGGVNHRIGAQLAFEGDVPIVDFRRDPLDARLHAENRRVGHECCILGSVLERIALREARCEARIGRQGIRKRTNLRGPGL